MTPESDRRRRTSSEDLREHTKALLARVTLAPGASALDLGCGRGEAIDLLSGLVGDTGRVVGVDLNEACVGSARAAARKHGLSNVEIIQADARRTQLPSAAFDLAHVRMLLVDTLAPGRVINEIALLVRPGGWVAILEPDGVLDAGHPPHLDRYVARRLPHLLATAGMEKIAVEARDPRRLPADRARKGSRIRWLPVGYFMAWARRPVF